MFDRITRGFAALALVVLPLAGCKGAESTCLKQGARAEISGNHGHAVEIPAEHVRRGVGGTYPLKGTEHEHVFVLRDDDMKELAAGHSVKTRASSVNGHTHEIEVRCQ